MLFALLDCFKHLPSQTLRILLGFAATLKDQRGRGAQAVVLARRIRDALGLGVRLMVTETGTAVDGEPQHSYRNIERAGFEAAYVRQNWISEDWAFRMRNATRVVST